MIAAWMLYAAAISLLVSITCSAGSRIAQRFGRQTRWIWILGLATALLIPASVLVDRQASGPASPSATPDAIGLAEGVRGAEAAEGRSSGGVRETVVAWPTTVRNGSRALGLDGWLLAAWGFASAFLLARLVGAVVLVRRRSRTWSARDDGDGVVLYTGGTGPAVSSTRGGAILLPQWFGELDERSRRLVLAHEKEHLRAGDHRLALAAEIATAVLPWNLPIWYLAARLRRALELDCDRRVLRSTSCDVRDYADALLSVAGRAVASGSTAVPFLESESALRERIEALAGGTPARPGLRVAGLAVLLLCVGFAASILPSPGPAWSASPATPASQVFYDRAGHPVDAPEFFPEPIGPPVSVDSVRQRHPTAFGPESEGGWPRVMICLSATGDVVTAQAGSAADTPAARAAVRLARERRYWPAFDDGEPVPVCFRRATAFRLPGTPSDLELGPGWVVDGERVDDEALLEVDPRTVDSIYHLDEEQVEDRFGLSGVGHGLRVLETR